MTEAEAACGVKRVLLELQSYAQWRPIDESLGKNPEALLAAGAISPESAAFLRDNNALFYGFDSGRIGNWIPVMEVLGSANGRPCRFIGFSSGHVGRRYLESTNAA